MLQYFWYDQSMCMVQLRQISISNISGYHMQGSICKLMSWQSNWLKTLYIISMRMRLFFNWISLIVAFICSHVIWSKITLTIIQSMFAYQHLLLVLNVDNVDSVIKDILIWMICKINMYSTQSCNRITFCTQAIREYVKISSSLIDYCVTIL